MGDQAVSVVIVSRHRAAALLRCLRGVAQLQYPNFEVVVVADPEGLEAIDTLDGMDAVKRVGFDEGNISAARNLGVSHAAGEIIAFIDDDAVPEPSWLRHLCAPAARQDVAAMGGFVRGRNGISWQNRARILDRHGAAQEIEVDPLQATVMVAPKGRAIKTEGTNMAVRRDVLVALGGFDPAFRFFLDETDLNMRLAWAGHATALVPLAQVHHGFAASARRRNDRVPRDLTEIGASWAVFQRKHVAKDDRAAHWAGIRAAERRRLLTHMVAGRLEPRDVRRLMRGLRRGYDAGLARPFGGGAIPRHSVRAFQRFETRRADPGFNAVPWRKRAQAMQAAADRVRAGGIETVLILTRTALFHRVSFEANGVWVQRGGIYGKAERSEPLVRLTTRARRAARERRRMAQVRGHDAG
ncbi:glycosyltransferase [Sulfitobacter albidus]|uniref:Glycosyltransferase n=1 Tax=Sulfitobacter albidus TaxID=2829501 RepID=A0A975JDM3_9RHOB|nr:glycosyltransferase [Sulfitobacter albidus]QUJ76140.1 glycosyltransferase [Sulfitobacter albidus]